MTDTEVWLITGAGRGMGVEIAQAALAAGDRVVATARDAKNVIEALGEAADLLAAGYFEEISPEQLRAQMETNFFGPLNVTRDVLPVMRRQRPAHIVRITSTAGIVSGGIGSAYGASKFALEGWTESLREEVEQFGIRVTAVEPGFFRTELLVEGSSTLWSELSIDDYADTASTIEAWKSMNWCGRSSSAAKKADAAFKIPLNSV